MQSTRWTGRHMKESKTDRRLEIEDIPASTPRCQRRCFRDFCEAVECGGFIFLWSMKINFFAVIKTVDRIFGDADDCPPTCCHTSGRPGVQVITGTEVVPDWVL